MPSHLVGLYKKDYPDNYSEIINDCKKTFLHVRLNNNVKDETLLKADGNAQKTLTGYFVKNNEKISLMNFEGDLTYMSLGSTLIAESVATATNNGNDILDVCAAPGGKSVYLSNRGFNVTSCDIYEHRVKLIQDYAHRMRTKLNCEIADGTVFNPQFEKRFDSVLVDAPCSGMGVVGRRKDSVFNKTYEQIKELSELQYKILSNSAKYVKSGGLLVYSTCTVFSIENRKVIDRFLNENADFSLSKIPLPYDNSGQIQFLPDGMGMEGFYLCHMKRN